MAYSNTITTPSTATATACTPGDVAGPGAHVRIEDLWYRYPGRDVASWTLQGIDLALRARRQGVTHLHAHFASASGRVAYIAAAL